MDYSSILINKVIKNRDALLFEAQKYGIETLSIFGSVAKGKANKDSDIDFLIESYNSLKNPFIISVDLKSKFKSILKTEVDIVFYDRLNYPMKFVIDRAKERGWVKKV